MQFDMTYNLKQHKKASTTLLSAVFPHMLLHSTTSGAEVIFPSIYHNHVCVKFKYLLA